MKAPSELAMSPLLRVMEPKTRPASQEGKNPFGDLLDAAGQNDITLDDKDVSDTVTLSQAMIQAIPLPKTPAILVGESDALPQIPVNDISVDGILSDAKPFEKAPVRLPVFTEQPESPFFLDPAPHALNEDPDASVPVTVPTGSVEAILPKENILRSIPSTAPFALSEAVEQETDVRLQVLTPHQPVPTIPTIHPDAAQAAPPAAVKTEPETVVENNPLPKAETNIGAQQAEPTPPALMAATNAAPLPVEKNTAELLADQIDAAFQEAAKNEQGGKGKRQSEKVAALLSGASNSHTAQGAVAALMQIANENRAGGKGASKEETGAIEMTAPRGTDSPQIQIIPGPHSASSAETAKSDLFAKTLREATHAPVAEQVQIHLSNNVKNGNKHFTIQLDPGDLGKVEVRLEIAADGKTVASIMADNKDTLDLLQRDARALERALTEAGLKTDSGSLSFNLRGGQQEQQAGREGAGYGKFFREGEAESELGVVLQMAGHNTRASLSALDIKV